MSKMQQLLAIGAVAILFCLLSADAATTSRSKYDNRGRYNPYYNDPYYSSRYLRNREYYQNRRYYDNFFKQYNPNVAAAEARIVEQTSESQHEGNYNYSYETENGIHGEEHGKSVNVGREEPAEVVEGSYSFITPEGVRVGVKYTADETGYHPVITYDGVNAEQFSRQQQPADVVISRIN